MCEWSGVHTIRRQDLCKYAMGYSINWSIRPPETLVNSINQVALCQQEISYYAIAFREAVGQKLGGHPSHALTSTYAVERTAQIGSIGTNICSVICLLVNILVSWCYRTSEPDGAVRPPFWGSGAIAKSTFLAVVLSKSLSHTQHTQRKDPGSARQEDTS